MSRWITSVNTFLEKLDDGVEIAGLDDYLMDSDQEEGVSGDNLEEFEDYDEDYNDEDYNDEDNQIYTADDEEGGVFDDYNDEEEEIDLNVEGEDIAAPLFPDDDAEGEEVQGESKDTKKKTVIDPSEVENSEVFQSGAYSADSKNPGVSFSKLTKMAAKAVAASPGSKQLSTMAAAAVAASQVASSTPAWIKNEEIEVETDQSDSSAKEVSFSKLTTIAAKAVGASSASKQLTTMAAKAVAASKRVVDEDKSAAGTQNQESSLGKHLTKMAAKAVVAASEGIKKGEQVEDFDNESTHDSRSTNNSVSDEATSLLQTQEEEDTNSFVSVRHDEMVGEEQKPLVQQPCVSVGHDGKQQPCVPVGHDGKVREEQEPIVQQPPTTEANEIESSRNEKRIPPYLPSGDDSNHKNISHTSDRPVKLPPVQMEKASLQVSSSQDKNDESSRPEDQAQMQNESEILKSENLFLEKENKKLKNEASNLQGEKKNLLNENMNLHGINRKLQDEMIALQNIISTLQKENKNLHNENKKIHNDNKKYQNEYKKIQNEQKKMRKQLQVMKSELEASENEVEAQREELERAAKRIELDHQRAQEEREDILYDHEDEIEQLKEEHEQEVKDTKDSYEAQLEDLRTRLQDEETKRMQEGGDWTKELEDALQRERDALKQFNEIQAEKSALQSQVHKLEHHQTLLQGKVESITQTAKTAAEREREAESKLDAAMSLHSRQLNQRHSREAELERTIAELSAALTTARHKSKTTDEKNAQSSSGGSMSKNESETIQHKYHIAIDELETIKAKFEIEKQRCEALGQELLDMSKERTEEASTSQARQHQQDRKEAELSSKVKRLEATIRRLKNDDKEVASVVIDKDLPPISASTTDSAALSAAVADSDSATRRAFVLQQELADAKKQITSLSEQLLKKRKAEETSKSEILALKGRLQSASARAEDAENRLVLATTSVQPATTQQPPSSNGSAFASNMYEMEGGGMIGYSSGGGGPTSRSRRNRRIKGAGGGMYLRGKRGVNNVVGVRSIRSALRLSAGRSGTTMEQITITIDALDSFLVDTGAFMGYEPFARLFFLFYFSMLHMWCFALVYFHATEVEHGDFASFRVKAGH